MTWQSFRAAVESAVTGAMLTAVSAPANGDGPTVTWSDGARPFAKHRILLSIVSSVFEHDRDSALSTGGAQTLSSMATITVQVLAESSFDSADTDALWLIEQVRLGLRRVTVREALAAATPAIAIVGFPLATRNVGYTADARAISAHAFDVAFRTTFTFASPDDAGLVEHLEAEGTGALAGIEIALDDPDPEP